MTDRGVEGDAVEPAVLGLTDKLERGLRNQGSQGSQGLSHRFEV